MGSLIPRQCKWSWSQTNHPHKCMSIPHRKHFPILRWWSMSICHLMLIIIHKCKCKMCRPTGQMQSLLLEILLAKWLTITQGVSLLLLSSFFTRSQKLDNPYKFCPICSSCTLSMLFEVVFTPPHALFRTLDSWFKGSSPFLGPLS